MRLSGHVGPQITWFRRFGHTRRAKRGCRNGPFHFIFALPTVDDIKTKKGTGMKRQSVLLLAILLLMGIAGTARGQANDTESFTVTVDPVLTIAAPLASTSITHDGTDTNQVFTAQRWTVTQNASAGASVTFATDQAFTHTTATTSKRDAKLDLSLFSSDTGSGWSVTTATDQTAFGAATPDGVAQVAASATAAGDAAFDLTVTFVETDFSTLPSGNYTMTVTGTITAN